MFMFKYYKNELPTIFNNMFNKNDDVHPYPTRQCYKLHLPKSKTTASVKYNVLSYGIVYVIKSIMIVTLFYLSNV